MTTKASSSRGHQAPPAIPARIDPAGWKPWAGLAGRAIVGGLLIFSGLHKAAAPAEEFMVVLEGYAILPDVYLSLFAHVLPWMELFAGAFLLGGLGTRWAAAATATLSSSFFAALLSTKIRGIALPNCGCFGQGVHLQRWQAMLLDAALIAFSVAAWRWGDRVAALDNWVDGGE